MTDVYEPVNDPLSSVIQDLNKLTTESSILTQESPLRSNELQTRTNEEFVDDSIDSPDSLDVGLINNRPIPPPRTKVPITASINYNNSMIPSTDLNNSAYKQIRSESDTDLLFSLTSTGNSLCSYYS